MPPPKYHFTTFYKSIALQRKGRAKKHSDNEDDDDAVKAAMSNIPLLRTMSQLRRRAEIPPSPKVVPPDISCSSYHHP
jgi:hypothetical protein